MEPIFGWRTSKGLTCCMSLHRETRHTVSHTSVTRASALTQLTMSRAHHSIGHVSLALTRQATTFSLGEAKSTHKTMWATRRCIWQLDQLSTFRTQGQLRSCWSKEPLGLLLKKTAFDPLTWSKKSKTMTSWRMSWRCSWTNNQPTYPAATSDSQCRKSRKAIRLSQLACSWYGERSLQIWPSSFLISTRADGCRFCIPCSSHHRSSSSWQLSCNLVTWEEARQFHSWS